MAKWGTLGVVKTREFEAKGNFNKKVRKNYPVIVNKP